MKIVTGGPLPPRPRVPAALTKEVDRICQAVRRQGDAALRRLGGLRRSDPLRVPAQGGRQAFRRLTPRDRGALEAACRHAGLLCRRELAALKAFDLKPTAGVTLYQRRVPVARVGLIVPEHGVSALISGAIAAAVAGVSERVVCAFSRQGAVDPRLLAAAYMADATEVFAVGGAAAVAALAYGTKSVSPVDFIVGAADQATRLAKRKVSAGCGVDDCDGPVELVVLADETASPEFVAADLLAQAELDPQAECHLVTVSAHLARRTQAVLAKRSRRLPRADPARGPCRRASAVVVADLAAAAAVVNDYAPQQLSLMVQRPDDLLGRLHRYGTVLVGPHTPAAVGLLATGASSLLPAARGAQGQGALGVATFLRPVTLQRVDPSAYGRLARTATTIAEMEGRTHAQRALEVRLVPLDED